MISGGKDKLEVDEANLLDDSKHFGEHKLVLRTKASPQQRKGVEEPRSNCGNANKNKKK